MTNPVYTLPIILIVFILINLLYFIDYKIIRIQLLILMLSSIQRIIQRKKISD